MSKKHTETMLPPQAPFDGLVTAPATVIGDPSWLAAQLAATARRYRLTRDRSVGVLWWYSASSVLLGPPAETYVRGGPVADPGAVTLLLHPDGRVLDARPGSTVDRAAAPNVVADLVSTCVSAVATASGAGPRALWAIATDSLANRVLWAGGAPSHAEALAADERFPAPRYVEVAGQRVVRRSSCCLLYEAPGQQKCVSCPRQTPDDRLRRLREVFG